MRIRPQIAKPEAAWEADDIMELPPLPGTQTSDLLHEREALKPF